MHFILFFNHDMDSQIPEALFQSTLKCLVDVVNSETATLSSVAMQALGHIGLCVPLPPLIHASDSGEEVVHMLVSQLSGCHFSKCN